MRLSGRIEFTVPSQLGFQSGTTAPSPVLESAAMWFRKAGGEPMAVKPPPTYTLASSRASARTVPLGAGSQVSGTLLPTSNAASPFLDTWAGPIRVNGPATYTVLPSVT